MGQVPSGLKKYLDYHVYKSALNGYLLRHAGGDDRPVFHDIDRICPQLNTLTRHYADIRAEFERVATSAVLPRYHDIDPRESEISAGGDPSKKWSVFMLNLLGHRLEENRARCPVTSRLIDGVPNLVQAFFSILDPRKSVPRHEGPYLGYLRYHLGLVVPEVNPPKLIVADQEHVWREGEAVMFDDSLPHEVVNESDGVRAVLIVDVLRPMSRMPTAVNRFMTDVVARNTYGRSVAKRVRAGQSAAPYGD